MAVEILLNGGFIATVDDADAAMVASYVWKASVCKGKHYTRVYAVRRSVTPEERALSRWVQMHKQILGFPSGPVVIDHRDGDGLNNQRMNLRRATAATNGTNQRARPNNPSGFKGVYAVPVPTKYATWFSTIKTASGGMYVRGSRSLDPAHSARAYDAAVREHYGEFGTYNFPRPGERSALTGLIEPLHKSAA